MCSMPVPRTVGEPARIGPGALLAALGEDLEPARAAEVYAALGYPVLPVFEPSPDGCTCRAGAGCTRAGKHPRITGGVWQATTDPAVVRRWWRRWPAANLALRTGVRFDVADVDGQPGVEALRALRTPLPVGAAADAGAPPGARRAASTAGPTAPASPPPPGPAVATIGGSYGPAALAAECARVRATPPGGKGRKGRNDALNRAAFKLGQLVHAGLLDRGQVCAALLDAATAAGLEPARSARTIDKAMTAARAKPPATPGRRVLLR